MMRLVALLVTFVLACGACVPAYAAPVADIEAWLQYVDEYMVYKTGMGYSASTSVAEIASASGLDQYQAASAVRSTTSAVKSSGIELPSGVTPAMLAGAIVVTAGVSIAGSWVSEGIAPSPQFYLADGTPVSDLELLLPENWGEKVYTYMPDGWFSVAQWEDGEVPPALMAGFIIPGSGVSYSFTPVYPDPTAPNEVAGPKYPEFDIRSVAFVNLGHPSYPRWGESEATLCGLIMQTVYGPSDQPIVPVLTQLTFTGGYERTIMRGWFNRITGTVSAAANYMTFDEADPFSKSNGPSIYTTRTDSVQGEVNWYEDQLAALITAGSVTVTGGPSTEVEPLAYPMPGPMYFPGSHAFTASGTEPGEYTPDELEEEWKLPAFLPSPVGQAIEQANPDTDIDLPVGVPSGVARWISNTWSDITAPVVSLFEGVDIFWPFRFMAAKG